MTESLYIGKLKERFLEPDFQYIHDLEMLRAIMRNSERTENYGSRGSWVNKHCLNLKDKYPEAVTSFLIEVEEEKERQQIRKEIKWQETLERHKPSPYLREQMEQLLETDEKQVRELMRLRDMLINSKKGYGGQAMAYLKVHLRDIYPEAYERFQDELRQ